MIYYASKMLNPAQGNYTTSKNELLVIIYAFDKFRTYLVLSKMVVYIDHVALRYLLSKTVAKLRLVDGSFFYKNLIWKSGIRRLRKCGGWSSFTFSRQRDLWFIFWRTFIQGLGKISSRVKSSVVCRFCKLHCWAKHSYPFDVSIVE